MRTHLVPTVEAFMEQVRREHGTDAVLHPANRTTACGLRMGERDVTTDPARITCKACARTVR